MPGIITWKCSVFVLYARLIFTCGQWNRWCARRICHAWLSRARLFLSTFWQGFICISCCFCWMLSSGIGYCCGAGSGWGTPIIYTSRSKAMPQINPVYRHWSIAYSVKPFLINALKSSGLLIHAGEVSSRILRWCRSKFISKVHCSILCTSWLRICSEEYSVSKYRINANLKRLRCFKSIRRISVWKPAAWPHILPATNASYPAAMAKILLQQSHYCGVICGLCQKKCGHSLCVTLR